MGNKMDSEEKEMLEETLELAKENNKMLQALKRQMQWGRIFQIVRWVIIVGAAVGAYYYIEPYLTSLFDTYHNLQAQIQSFGDSIR